MTFVQTILANPLAVSLDRVLAYHGPATLQAWIRDQTTVTDLVSAEGLAEGVWSHPTLMKLGRSQIRRAFETWRIEESAALLDVMLGVAPAVAQEQAPPAQQIPLAQALQAMCQQLAQPTVFPWFCRQCDALRLRILAVLDENPPRKP